MRTQEIDLELATPAESLGYYRALGQDWLITEDYYRAGACLSLALSFALEVHGERSREVCELYEALGRAFSLQGDHYRALNYLERAISLYLEIEGPNPLAELWATHLATAQRCRGEFSLAVDSLASRVALSPLAQKNKGAEA